MDQKLKNPAVTGILIISFPSFPFRVRPHPPNPNGSRSRFASGAMSRTGGRRRIFDGLPIPADKSVSVPSSLSCYPVPLGGRRSLNCCRCSTSRKGSRGLTRVGRRRASTRCRTSCTSSPPRTARARSSSSRSRATSSRTSSTRSSTPTTMASTRPSRTTPRSDPPPILARIVVSFGLMMNIFALCGGLCIYIYIYIYRSCGCSASLRRASPGSRGRWPRPRNCLGGRTSTSGSCGTAPSHCAMCSPFLIRWRMLPRSVHTLHLFQSFIMFQADVIWKLFARKTVVSFYRYFSNFVYQIRVSKYEKVSLITTSFFGRIVN